VDSGSGARTDPYPYPGKILFGAGSAGDYIVCNDPVFAYYEDPTVDGDEHNAWGIKSGRKGAYEEPAVVVLGIEDQMFSCVEFDIIPPNVTTLTALPGTETLGHAITINVSVVDNTEVDYAYAQISMPNGTLRNISLTDIDSDNYYDGQFSETYIRGQYTVTIIANDTYANINNTEITTFTIDYDNLSLTTDKPDYIVNETVTVYGTGFEAFTNVTIAIYNSTGSIVNISAFPRNVTSNSTCFRILANNITHYYS